MIELGALAVLAFMVVALVSAVFAVLAIVLKAIVWIVMLPFRIIVGLVLLPLMLLKLVLGGLLLLVFGPVIAIALVLGLVGFVLAAVTPLLPLLLIGFIVWLVVRGTGGPAPAAGVRS